MQRLSQARSQAGHAPGARHAPVRPRQGACSRHTLLRSQGTGLQAARPQAIVTPPQRDPEEMPGSKRPYVPSPSTFPEEMPGGEGRPEVELPGRRDTDLPEFRPPETVEYPDELGFDPVRRPEPEPGYQEQPRVPEFPEPGPYIPVPGERPGEGEPEPVDSSRGEGRGQGRGEGLGSDTAEGEGLAADVPQNPS